MPLLRTFVTQQSYCGGLLRFKMTIKFLVNQFIRLYIEKQLDFFFSIYT